MADNRKVFAFYRVCYSKEGGNSGGYSFHASEKEAIDAARFDFDNDPSEYDNVFAPNERIDIVEVAPTKKSILAILNSYATHPDNG